MGLVPNSPTRKSNPHLPTTLDRLLDSLTLFPYDSAVKYRDVTSTRREEMNQVRAAVKVSMPSLRTSGEWSGQVFVEAEKPSEHMSMSTGTWPEASTPF